MAVEFRPQRADLALQAIYAEPLFSIWRAPDRLLNILFLRLSTFGLQLNDLKWGPSSSIGDTHLAFFLLNFTLAVRIRIDRLEVDILDLSRVDLDRAEQATVLLLDGLLEHEPSLRVSTYVLSTNYHGKVDEKPAREFIDTLVTSGDHATLGPSIGRGTVFYFGAAEDRISSAITFDMSAAVPDGLFLRIHIVWNAAGVGAADLRTRARDYSARVLSEFGLTVNAS